jgi:hypothetical protein
MEVTPEGDVLAEHAATIARRVFAVLLLVLPGLGLLALTTQAEPDARIPLAVIGIVLVGLGALAILQQNKTRVVVRADGLERWGLRGRLWALRWQDAPEMRYRVVKLRMGGLLGLLLPALGTNVHIGLADPGGKTRWVPPNLKGIDVLAERAIEQHTTAHFADARRKIDGGEELRFGKSLVLDKEKVSVKKLFRGMQPCPLTEIEKVAVEGGILKIRQRGKTFAFASLYTATIPNVFLLLRLLESLLGQKKAGGGTQGHDFAADQHVVA